MAMGISVVSVDERPALSRGGKPVNQVVISVETDRGATGTITLEAVVYSQIVNDPGALSQLLEAKRTELDAPFEA